MRSDRLPSARRARLHARDIYPIEKTCRRRAFYGERIEWLAMEDFTLAAAPRQNKEWIFRPRSNGFPKHQAFHSARPINHR
jgi:hypothetical protein